VAGPQLVHRDGLSIRQAQRVIAEQHGIRRSLGHIWNDLHGYVCLHCLLDEPTPAT
jgi:hypothetical protein